MKLPSLQGNETPFMGINTSTSTQTPPNAHLSSSRYPPVGLIFNGPAPPVPPPPPNHHHHTQIPHHQQMPTVQQPTVYSHPEVAGPHSSTGVTRVRHCQQTVIVSFCSFTIHLKKC